MNKSILFALLLLPAISFAGTVTFYPIPVAAAPADTILFDSSTASGFVSGGSPLTWNMTVGSGADRYMVLVCGTRISDTVTSATYNGVSMTLSTNTFSGGQEQTYIYTLSAPASGSHGFSVAAGSGISDRIKCGGISYSGVAQSGAVEFSTGTRNGGGTNQSNTLTTTSAGDAIIDVVSDVNGDTPVAGDGQTIKFLEGTGWLVYASTRATTTAGTYTTGWTGINTTSCQSSIAIKPGP